MAAFLRTLGGFAGCWWKAVERLVWTGGMETRLMAGYGAECPYWRWFSGQYTELFTCRVVWQVEHLASEVKVPSVVRWDLDYICDSLVECTINGDDFADSPLNCFSAGARAWADCQPRRSYQSAWNKVCGMPREWVEATDQLTIKVCGCHGSGLRPRINSPIQRRACPACVLNQILCRSHFSTSCQPF